MAFQNFNYSPYGGYAPPTAYGPRADLYAAIPQGQPQNQQNGMQGLSPTSRPVTNREEANAVSADFSGALMVFPDITNNKVYIKRWNISAGAAEFYEFVPAQPEQLEVVEYVSMKDFNVLAEEVNRLKKAKTKKAEVEDE